MFEAISYSLYSITYADRPAEHFFPGRIEARKATRNAPTRAEATEIEPIKEATQSQVML